MDILNLIKTKRRPILYGIAGCINTLVDFAVFKVVRILTGLPAEYCQAIGYCAGVLCSFLLNSRFAFRDGNAGPLYLRIIRFIFVNSVSLIIGTFGIKALIGMSLEENVSKAIITVIVAIVNYFGYKILVFRVKD